MPSSCLVIHAPRDCDLLAKLHEATKRRKLEAPCKTAVDVTNDGITVYMDRTVIHQKYNGDLEKAYKQEVRPLMWNQIKCT